MSLRKFSAYVFPSTYSLQSATSNSHVAEERGLLPLNDSGEEDKYSSVLRPSAKPAPSTKHQKKTPTPTPKQQNLPAELPTFDSIADGGSWADEVEAARIPISNFLG